MVFFKKVFKNSKIDTSKIPSINNFSTHNSIRGFLGNYLQENKESIIKGRTYHNEFNKFYNEEFKEELCSLIDVESFKSKFDFLNNQGDIHVGINKDHSVLNVIYEESEINLVEIIALGAVITREIDINKLINSKDFKVFLKTIYLYLKFVNEYTDRNREEISSFSSNKKLNSEDYINEFDTLSTMTWKLARDNEALKYACKKASISNKEISHAVRDVINFVTVARCLSLATGFMY